MNSRRGKKAQQAIGRTIYVGMQQNLPEMTIMMPDPYINCSSSIAALVAEMLNAS